MVHPFVSLFLILELHSTEIHKFGLIAGRLPDRPRQHGSDPTVPGCKHDVLPKEQTLFALSLEAISKLGRNSGYAFLVWNSEFWVEVAITCTFFKIVLGFC